jgi:hypothetical protein
MLAEVERVRESRVLGASGRLVELFDYLLARSAEGRSPKESEIALAVFGKTDADSLRDDPVARVYVHRLRKRLDDFYLRNGMPAGVRLDLPKGDYRIVCLNPAEAAEAPAPPAETDNEKASASPKPESRRRWALIGAAAAAVMIAGNVAAWAVFANRAPVAETQLADTAVWSGLANSSRPLLVVVGDYYMFGEYENRLSLKRLIRDFNINSKADLVHAYRDDPKAFDRYSDVALQYLPTSAAFAIADLAPILEGDRDVQVMLASELTPDRLKSSDIIYVGLLSGMGPLRDPVFAQSRFSFGESYDQIVDRNSGKTYTSEAFRAAPSDTMYRDYGFFSTFKGPTGNRIAILSGSRDTAVMGVAEKLTRLSELAEVEQKAAGADSFEALFEVKGQKHMNLETRVLASYPVDSSSIWTGANANTVTVPSER